MNRRKIIRRLVIGLCLAIIFFLSIYLKSGYYRGMPFFPDGDTYYPGMMAKFIIETGHTTTNVPFEVPATPNGAPLVFPILITQLHQLTHISILVLLRWFGPVISAIIGLAIYALLKRTTKSEALALFGYALALFIPLYSGRLSATFPESIILYFIPVSLLLLIYAAEEHHWGSLIAAVLISVSAIGYHFVSYLLWPPLFLGAVMFFVGRHWRKRNLIFLLVFVGTSILAVLLLFSNWWLFGFLQSLFHIYSGSALSGTSTLRAYTLPAPTVGQWYDFLGYLPVILAIIGAVVFFFSRKYSWRTKVIITGSIVTMLLPLQILPVLRLFSYTPWRAFVYITPAIIFVAALSFSLLQRYRQASWITLFFFAAVFLTLIPNYNAPAVVGAGEQQLTKGEYKGFVWLHDHTNRQSVIVTAPANGRQMVFFTNADVAYDTGLPVFNAKTTNEAIEEIHKLGSYDEAFIYISKYKLGPVYNYGWTRDYANVRSDLSKFETSNRFPVVYEDIDSLIFKYQ